MKRILAKCAMCALLIALASCGAKSEKQNNDVAEEKTEQQNLNIFNDLGVDFGMQKDVIFKKLEDISESYFVDDEDYDIYGITQRTKEFTIQFMVMMDFDEDKLHRIDMMSEVLYLNESEIKAKFEDIVSRFNKRGYKVTENRSDSLSVESDYWTMQLWSNKLDDYRTIFKMEVTELPKQ